MCLFLGNMQGDPAIMIAGSVPRAEEGGGDDGTVQGGGMMTMQDTDILARLRVFLNRPENVRSMKDAILAKRVFLDSVGLHDQVRSTYKPCFSLSLSVSLCLSLSLSLTHTHVPTDQL